MKKVAKRVTSLVLAVMMVFTSMLFDVTEEVKADSTYELTVSPSAPAGEVGETIALNATITKDGEEVSDLSAENLAVYWWCTNNDNEGVTYDSSSSTLTNNVTINAAGEYYFTVKLQETVGWTTIKEVYITLTGLEAGTPEYDITVSPSAPTGEEGETISVVAAVTADGESVTDLEANGLAVFWWCTNEDPSGVTYDYSNSTLTNEIKLNTAGEYYFTVKLQETTNWTTLKEVYITVTVTEAENPVINYAVTITPETTEITKGDVVKLDAAVTADDVPVTDLETAGLEIKWSLEEGELSDATFDSTDKLTTNVTLPSEGSYVIVADIIDVNGEIVATTTVELVAEAPEDEVRKIELQNGDFNQEIVENDPVWIGTCNTDPWPDGNRFYRFKYASDAWLELASYCSGAYCMKMEAVAGDTLQVVQYLESLEAGTYTMIVPVMGGDGSVKVVLGDQVSEAYTLQGWNNWSYVKVTFVIDEDMTDVPVGIKLVSSSSVGGWAFVDSISLYKGVPATGDNNQIWTYVILLTAGAAFALYGKKKFA